MARVCGTRRRYNMDGCRCDACKEAIVQYNIQRAERKRNRNVLLPVQPIYELASREIRDRHQQFFRTNWEKGVKLYTADKWCVKLGYHPWTVYGDKWFEAAWKEQNEQE